VGPKHRVKWRRRERIEEGVKKAALASAAYISVITLGVPLAEIDLALSQGEYVRAEGIAPPLVASLQRGGIGAFLHKALYFLGRALAGQGRLEQAFSRLVEACAAAESLGPRWTPWQILAAQSEIEGDLGNADESGRLRIQAREIVEFIANRTPPEL
jgi:hypothetical protein